jgi:hypothetical protein
MLVLDVLSRDDEPIEPVSCISTVWNITKRHAIRNAEPAKAISTQTNHPWL